MDYDLQLEIKIINLLAESSIGMTISEISRKLDVNRNTVSKYLQILEAQNKIVHRQIASAKLFSLALETNITRLIDIFQVPLVVINEQLNIIIANKPFQNLIGHSEQELYNHKITKFLSNPRNTSFRRILNNLIKSQDLFVMAETMIQNKTYEILLTPVILENSQTGLSIQFITSSESQSLVLSNDTINVINSIIQSFPIFVAIIDVQSKRVLTVNNNCEPLDKSGIYKTKYHKKRQSLTRDEIQHFIDKYDSIYPFLLAIDFFYCYGTLFRTLMTRNIRTENQDLIIVYGFCQISDEISHHPYKISLQLIETMSSIIAQTFKTDEIELESYKRINHLSQKISNDLLLTGVINYKTKLLDVLFLKSTFEMANRLSPARRGLFNLGTSIKLGNPEQMYQSLLSGIAQANLLTVQELEEQLRKIQFTDMSCILDSNKILFSLIGRFNNKVTTEIESEYLQLMTLLISFLAKQ